MNDIRDIPRNMTEARKAAAEAAVPLNAFGVPCLKVWIFLDNLRDSGVTNMFAASPFLQKRFAFSPKEAVAELSRWMEGFN
jgi:hypothetical protein